MRVAEYAFKFAKDNNRQRVTAVHKANIMLVVAMITATVLLSLVEWQSQLLFLFLNGALVQ